MCPHLVRAFLDSKGLRDRLSERVGVIVSYRLAVRHLSGLPDTTTAAEHAFARAMHGAAVSDLNRIGMRPSDVPWPQGDPTATTPRKQPIKHIVRSYRWTGVGGW